jgi:hypothetical protein
MVLASSDSWRGGSTPARIWGQAAAGESVQLSGLPAGAAVLPSNPFTADSEGFWSITAAVPASLTNYSLVFAGKANSVTLADVLFGHTMLCSGQVRESPSLSLCASVAPCPVRSSSSYLSLCFLSSPLLLLAPAPLSPIWT